MSSIYANPYSQSVKINGFGLGIAAGVPVKKILKRGAVYLSVPDLTEYKLLLSNDNATRCDVTVYIDEVDVGTWRLNPYSSASIERPAGVQKKFVLIKEGTSAAYQSGIGTYDTNGLVRAIFKPEKQRMRPRHVAVVRNPSHYYNNMYDQLSSATSNLESTNQSFGAASVSPAGTGLGNYSNQQFDQTDRLFNIDYSNITTINVRLVVEDEPYSPDRLVSLRQYPKQTANRVPPKINGYDYDYNYDTGLYYDNSNDYNNPNNNYYYDYTTNQYFARR